MERVTIEYSPAPFGAGLAQSVLRIPMAFTACSQCIREAVFPSRLLKYLMLPYLQLRHTRKRPSLI